MAAMGKLLCQADYKPQDTWRSPDELSASGAYNLPGLMFQRPTCYNKKNVLGPTGAGGCLPTWGARRALRPFSGGVYFLFRVGEWASLDRWERMSVLSRKADQELWELGFRTGL